MERLHQKFRSHNPFRRHADSQNVKARTNQAKAQADSTTSIPLPASPGQSSIQCTQPTQPTPDLWKIAYDHLDGEQREILSNLNDKGNHSQTKALLDEVIHVTKEKYEEYQQKADGTLRQTSRKIINATLSFKDIITAVAGIDPTQHAASAWAIVSLGLTMTKNHNDLRDALFESSEYLSDVLTQCAFIERNFYLDGSSSIKEDVGNALVRLYGAILRYTAQIRDAQHPRVGRKVLDSVTAITDHPLTKLQASVDKERDNLFRWIGLVKHLHCEKEAEDILSQIDALADSMKHLIEQFRLVNLRIAEGAFYDSYINEHEDFCHPETRPELRSQISEWAESTDDKCIFWLNGMAGTGKSTIARTVAQSFKDKGQLGATFFFKRGEADRGNAKYLISTITRQLVIRHRWLVPDVLSAIENDPNISSKFLSEQFDKLLLQPLLKLHLSQPTTIVIVIDALDECDREEDIQVILRLLFRLQNFQSVRLRIFLTSRPELPIRLGFKQNDNHQDVFLHELPISIIKRDIRLFLKDKLLKIRDERSLSSDWPGYKNIEKLVKIAAPLFIFAATICRFVGEKRWRPEERLETFLREQETSSGSRMDRTYLPILNQLLSGANDREIKQLTQEFQDIVGVIILLATPLSVNVLAQLISLPIIDISNRLDGFHSVLSVPENTNSPIRTLHSSFRDYLLTTESPFRVNKEETHARIASHCLRIMDHHLSRNICSLASYGTQRKDIDNQVIKHNISAELKYSCHYWVEHLKESKGHVSESEILAFLKKHFLHWLEALSLIGIASEAVGIIDTLKSDVWGTNTELSDFLYDAKRFTLKNIYIASIAPRQLYSSGLVFSPMQSIIKKNFSYIIPKEFRTLPKVEDYWSPGLQTFEGHSGWVNSVAISLDGKTVVSGSRDETIKLWDVKTSSELQTLKGHSEWVSSVAFSPDGQTVASGSRDETVKLWNAKTGSELRTLKGHSKSVLSVAFSRDGQTVVSGSRDRTIKLWNVKTGSESKTLKGHSGWVNSVAISPDGKTVVSGSRDKTIKLWDVKTGSELRTLKGHSEWVSSVAFSPDGQTVVSGSRDRTIKLWNAKTGSELQTLRDHSECVNSVTFFPFSPDSQTVVSGSDDRTIKLWDVKTGSELQALKGHSGMVNSVAFSPDSQMVASGSCDKTVKLWDVKTGSESKTLKGHLGVVNSVAISPDGKMVVSGSRDKTIKLWDMKTGSELQPLKGHSKSVLSVAFSPDGQTVASGSRDETVKLWDVKTGSELQTLECHLGVVNSVAFSTNGQTVVSGSRDRTIKLWNAKTDSELQTLECHSVASTLCAEEQSTTKPTSIPQLCDNRDPTSRNYNPQVSLSDNWVTLAGENILWLPPEHRQFTASTIKETNLALGYIDGRVSIMGFHI